MWGNPEVAGRRPCRVEADRGRFGAGVDRHAPPGAITRSLLPETSGSTGHGTRNTGLTSTSITWRALRGDGQDLEVRRPIDRASLMNRGAPANGDTSSVIEFSALRGDWYHGVDYVVRLIRHAAVASSSAMLFSGFPRQWIPLFSWLGIAWRARPICRFSRCSTKRGS